MLYYKLDENGKIQTFSEHKREGWLMTDKNIVYGFDGQLVFEDELKSTDYVNRKQEFDSKLKQENQKVEIELRLNQLTQDFIQVLCGADFGTYINDKGQTVDIIEERKQEFQTLHNELRTLQGKEPRMYE